MITANGPSSADQQIDVNVDPIGATAQPYILHDTPSVLSVGVRCVEEGFDFVWKAFSRPYFRTPKGKKVFLDVRDYVPFLRQTPDFFAVPAKRDNVPKPKPDTSSEEPAGGRETRKTERKMKNRSTTREDWPK
jgi:hypothetical protein